MIRKELDSRPQWHVYQRLKRVWAQKPFDERPTAERKIEVENLGIGSDEEKMPSVKKQKMTPASPEHTA